MGQADDMKHVVVLTGGDVKGVFQIGALRAILEKEKVDAYVGTSVGSVNAALVSNMSTRGAEHAWFKLKKRSDIMRSRWWKGPWLKGAYTLNPLKENLVDALKNTDGMCSTPYYAVVSDFKTGQTSLQRCDQLFLEDQLKWMIASSAVAPIHEGVEDYFFDGGHRDIAGTKFAIKHLQADKVTVISTSPLDESKFEHWELKWPYVVNYALRAIDLLATETLRNDIKMCELYNKTKTRRHVECRVIDPAEPLELGLGEVDHEKWRKYVNHGYARAKEILK